MPDKKIYTVKLPIQRNGVRYLIGQIIELEHEIFEELKEFLVIPDWAKPKSETVAPVEPVVVSVEPTPSPEPIAPTEPVVSTEPTPGPVSLPFTEVADDVLSEPQAEILPPSVETETQEEKSTTVKKPRTRS